MGFRIRKRIKIASGLYVNLSKGGTSVSIGGRGASVNLGGKRGPRATVGLPGTGISYSTSLAKKTTETEGQPLPQYQTKPAGMSALRLLFYGILALILLQLIFG